MKLKTKIIHSFDVEENLVDDLDFSFEFPHKSIKLKTKIVEVKKVNNQKFQKKKH
jgi:hypothetical protein